MDIDFDCQPHTSNKAISSIYSELLSSEEQLNRRPAYQRSPVWDEEQKGNLIDSIMKQCPMPVFLLYCYEKEENECIDGQNRLTAIKEYIEQTAATKGGPWPLTRDYEDRIEHIFYNNPVTKDAMAAYCATNTREPKAGKKAKIYRLMTPIEVKRFNGYQCTIAEIKTKLTFDQRKDIFLRWQSGTGISQCDKFKNDDTPFCNFVIDQGLERTLAPLLIRCIKTGRSNWLFDLYRLLNLFYEGNTEPAAVFISTIKSRTRIKAQTVVEFSQEEMKNAVKRAERFLSRFSFLEKAAKQVYSSDLLQIAFVWTTVPTHIKDVMETEDFMLNFVKAISADETMVHNTLNNGPNEVAILEAYPRFRTALLVAYDEQKPEVAVTAVTATKKKSKDTIPAIRKTEVWNTYVGVAIGATKCLCCGLRDITARDFHTGHVLSEEDGGTIDVENLRPICAPCNSGMGSKHMVAWMKKMYPGRLLPQAIKSE